MKSNEERIKDLEVEASYLRREIDRLCLFILNKKGNINHINYNFAGTVEEEGYKITGLNYN